MAVACTQITSAAGILSLLDEPAPELRVFALKKLDQIVDEFWPEISEAIEKIETLSDDAVFAERKLAALVASKVYYHLGAFGDARTYALRAGDLFDVNSRSEYVDTTIAECIDHYVERRKASYAKTEGGAGTSAATATEGAPADGVEPELVAIVDRMFRRCLVDGQHRQVLGLALETRRMDVFEEAILQAEDPAAMLQYAFSVAMGLLQNRGFRNAVLRSLVGLYRSLATPDYVNVCQCLIFLDDATAVGEILRDLVSGAPESASMAYQIGFDLYDSATQRFLDRVLRALRSSAPVPAALEPKTSAQGRPPARNEDAERALERELEALGDEEKAVQGRFERLASILGGDVSIGLQLQFLIRSNRADMLVLKNTKDAIRVSICHTATVMANAFMHSGTTSDQFLRDNLDWLARATNWAKLTATASLGVIHRGHETESLALMQSYLPKEAGPSSGYSEGGGLYALGLIHANHGANIVDYLLQQLKDAQNEMVRHGGCLGLGLAAMGTHRQDVYEQLKLNLYQDDAVTGEAAGVAMGMVMLGSRNATAIEDMVAYAQETQHEKILRGLAVGIALTMYGRLEEADALVEQLLRDKDPLLRRAGCYTLAVAYCGTGNNGAIRTLLHVAVSDVNDDVRRAAVMGLGFLLFRTPEQCPSVVSLLAESYNPHVRYGAAMALGIACAGTGQREAIALLEPMLKFDPVNFVRQGALIASAMILIQQTEALCPKVTFFRQLYAQVISNKHEDVMAKFGAILAQGIIDAGGRNVTVSLLSRTGHTNMVAVVGMLAFTQYWYWFPLAHCLSLAFTPTCLIALNSDLKMPQLDFKSNAKPSLYAYPAPLEEKKREERERVTTAVLSISAARARRRAHASDHSSSTITKMDVDEEEKKPDKKIVSISKSELSKSDKESKGETSDEKDKEKDSKEVKEKKEPEPSFEILNNPARVMRQQLKVTSLVEGSGYTPLKDVSIGGIIMLHHSAGGEQVLVEPVAAFGPKPEEEKEPDPPEPFEYIED